MNDNDEPLTVSWLKQVGFRPDNERPFYWTNAKNIHSLKAACFDLMIWENGTWEVANADNSIILRTHAGNRGDVRRLCAVLGIALKDEPPTPKGAAMNSEHWQPIETAPKDGTRVLLCVVGHSGQRDDREYYHMASWGVDHWTPFIPNDWTHWMPLPEPPTPGATYVAIHEET